MTDLDTNPSNKRRVVVAMSGGVDSSVAAALLVEQGYDVIGMMMRLWSEPSKGSSPIANRCCTPDQMADARRIADQLQIPFYVLDMQETFRQTIVQFFIDEHALGRTPNPCIECNRQIRFTELLNHALALDADFLATGHYARVERSSSGYQLKKGLDEGKDQSYVLHMLNQRQLSQVIFPVGSYNKSQVRELARKFNLPVASKQESQDLCFLGDGDYRRFLSEYDANSSNPGPILDTAGHTLGQHTGLSFYTIGQRKGLGVSSQVPLFVLGKDVRRNSLLVGTRDELGQQQLTARDVNWISGVPPDRPIEAWVKVRYKAKAVPATVTALPKDRAAVLIKEPVFGATPGQGAVFFVDDNCIGGGIIADSVYETGLHQLEGDEDGS